MKQYIDLVKTVLNEGKVKDNRTGIKTISYPIGHFRHNMADGFPLLTTRKLNLKNIAVEVEGYIKGITSKKWFQDRGNHYWDHWANPEEVMKKSAEWQELHGAKGTKQAVKNLEDSIAVELDDLGPFYSWQLRRFGQVYNEDCDGILGHYDQLSDIVHKLDVNPDDRRMVASYWCPFQLKFQSLPPCICLWNINVLDGYINLSWHQRSCDLMIGAPADIAHHALLLLLLCKQSGFKPGILGAQFHDLHIYTNHIDTAKVQLGREPKQLPFVDIINFSNIFSWTHQDISISNYTPHDSLKYEIAI
jgi:thymidylate synthase